jgi:hypothetical protein
MKLDDQTIEDMSNFLSRDSRLKLLDKLAKICGKRPREKISMRTGIAKTHMYRYLPKDKSSKRTVPNEKTTRKFIKELLKDGALQSVIVELDMVETRLRRVAREYRKWKTEMKKHGLVSNPLSNYDMKKLEESL